MELNRESIAKALEHCHYHYSCTECPYFNKWELCENLSINAASLIKELIEENKKLLNDLINAEVKLEGLNNG